MKKYTFKSDESEITVDASSYQEALAALIFEVGSEAEAARFTFIGEQE